MLLDLLYSKFHIFLLFSFPHQECLLQKFGKLIQLGGSSLGWAEALCPGVGRWKGWKGYLWAQGLRAAGGQAVGESYVIQFHVQRLHHTILYHHAFKKIPLESCCLWFYPLPVELYLRWPDFGSWNGATPYTMETLLSHGFSKKDTNQLSSNKSVFFPKAAVESARSRSLPLVLWARPHSSITKTTLTLRHVTTWTPLTIRTPACYTNPGRWVLQQPEVKVPGTSNSTPFLLLNSSARFTLFSGSLSNTTTGRIASSTFISTTAETEFLRPQGPALLSAWFQEPSRSHRLSGTRRDLGRQPRGPQPRGRKQSRQVQAGPEVITSATRPAVGGGWRRGQWWLEAGPATYLVFFVIFVLIPSLSSSHPALQYQVPETRNTVSMFMC